MQLLLDARGEVLSFNSATPAGTPHSGYRYPEFMPTWQVDEVSTGYRRHPRSPCSLSSLLFVFCASLFRSLSIVCLKNVCVCVCVWTTYPTN